MSRRATTAQRREAAEARRAHRASITEPDLVMEAAAGFLAVRPRSVEETRRRLAHLGYPAALCDQVIERLLEMGYLDDAAFARAWVDSRDRARPRGSSALRSELRRKGVPDSTIREILDERAATGAAPMVGVTATMPPADGGRRGGPRGGPSPARATGFGTVAGDRPPATPTEGLRPAGPQRLQSRHLPGAGLERGGRPSGRRHRRRLTLFALHR